MGEGEGRIVAASLRVDGRTPVRGPGLRLREPQGALTDINGRYLILKVTSGTHDLVAEMLGFAHEDRHRRGRG